MIYKVKDYSSSRSRLQTHSIGDKMDILNLFCLFIFFFIDEQGITLVAYHVKFNEDFYSLEAGVISIDIIKPRNGRWVYEDHTTELKNGDMIYFWVHVVYQGLGYNLLNQEHRVTGLY